jgi:uncharacterized membrane protein
VKRKEPPRKKAKASAQRPGSRLHATALVGLALVGLLVSLYLTYVHHRLQREPGWRSACAFTEAISCDTVLSSPYGSIAGTPLSAVGAWFYAVLAIVALAGLRRAGERSHPSGATFLLVASSLACLVSVGLAALSVSIGSLCPLCAVLYVVNVAMLLVSWHFLGRAGYGPVQAFAAEGRAWKRRLSPLAAALLALLALFWFFPREDVVPAARATAPLPPQSPLCQAVDQLRAGSAPAVELITYTDFQCDRCRDLNEMLRPVRHDPRLRIVHRHCPVDRECNPMMQHAGHAGACLQARAAICAEGAGHQESFADALFAGGPKDEAGLLALASSQGLDADAFASCLRATETRARLDADVAAAMAAGVRGTPTMIVNGVKQAGSLSAADQACLASLEVAQR